MRRALVAVLAAGLGGCGYTGEPLPPLMNIPSRVSDLAVFEKGSQLVAEFSVPRLTTEGVVIRGPVTLELRGGEGGRQFDANAWAANSKLFPAPAVDKGRAYIEIPAAPWIGKDVVFGVKTVGANGKDAGWSNFVALSVVPPLAPPAHLRAEAVATGVRLTWEGSAPNYRVFRQADAESSPKAVAETDQPEWIDNGTQYGQTYRYMVQAFRKSDDANAQSENSPEQRITPQDIFPPAVPRGLTAVTSTHSIELAWEPNTEPDLAGYRLYRAAPAQKFERLADTQQTPSYSDRKIEAGKTYRYAISAVDKAGNESQLSAPVELTAPEGLAPAAPPGPPPICGRPADTARRAG